MCDLSHQPHRWRILAAQPFDKLCLMKKTLIRPLKINGLFLVQNFSKLDAHARQNKQEKNAMRMQSISPLFLPESEENEHVRRIRNKPFILSSLIFFATYSHLNKRNTCHYKYTLPQRESYVLTGRSGPPHVNYIL